jgi:serine/threonine-protein kinase
MSKLTDKKDGGAGGQGFVLKRGKLLGKYRLVKRIGKGGYCEVWKARDSVEGLWVALKIPLLDNGQRDSESLLKEIRLVSQLRHPHIMPVKNADIIEGHAVLATELSVGTLADCSKPMGARRIINITGQVLEGLAYAHGKRLVHCDVTPGNIFLFPNGRAALGDFGIGILLKGRMKTVDEYGTPGYVAPEQAYGRPTVRSDCFAVGLILYEYMTGVLLKWPFRWPFRGHERLRGRSSVGFVRFVRKALSVDPARRFANGGQMLGAFREAVPKQFRSALALKLVRSKRSDWRQLRREAFVKRYGKVFLSLSSCVECGEPVDESMQICPWCGSGANRFDYSSRFSHICVRCSRGVAAEWNYCPWCYGGGFDASGGASSKGVRYHGKCRHCKGKLIRFMRYCPWCRRKVRKAWQVWAFPEVCGGCGWSVDTTFWNYCPWCKQKLT